MKISFSHALVTGGAGFIGSHIVDALVESGCTVSVVDNLSTGHLSNLSHLKDRIRFFEGDIRDGELLSKIIPGCDIVFHEAAVVSVPQTVEAPVESAMINELGTLNILEAARKNRVRRVVMASSCAVYGNDPRLPKHEGLSPAPESPYAVQKLTGELYAGIYPGLYGLETVCLRYFNVYGPRQDPDSPYSGVISIFMTKAASKQQPTIFGDGRQNRDFIFVKDVVKANLLAGSVDGVVGGVFNVGTGKSISLNDLWENVCRVSGCSLEPAYAPRRAGDIRESVADIGKAESALGFAPDYPFERGLEPTYRWYRETLSRKIR
jgi:nucleoside-diphosphate-sugar epimerase